MWCTNRYVYYKSDNEVSWQCTSHDTPTCPLLSSFRIQSQIMEIILKTNDYLDNWKHFPFFSLISQ